MVAVPEPTEAAIRYYQTGLWIWGAAVLWSFLVPLLAVATSLGTRVRAFAERRGVPGWLQPSVVFGVYFLFATVLELPWAYGIGYVRAHSYGLSVQTLGKWASDMLKGMAIELLLGLGAAWLFFLLIRRFARTWWLWLAALTVPLAAVLAWIAPLAIDPLFNDFRRLGDGSLSTEIVALAERAGVSGVETFEVAKGVDTTAVNAYVTGFAGSHRVVLWDTLLAKLEADEVMAVVAHELGHYVLGHVALGVGLSGLGALAALFASDRIMRSTLRRRGGRLQIRGLSDPAALPLWVLVLTLVSFAGQPVGLAVSRSMERAADRFGMELTGNSEAAGRAFVALQKHNLSYPRPARWVVWLRSSHPPLAERIEFANRSPERVRNAPGPPVSR